MKKILYLSFYFEPDLCAGSFRNTPLVKELAKQSKGKALIDVVTTLPNRYSSYVAEALEFEEKDNYTVKRLVIPKHKSGMQDQVLSFKSYYQQVKKYVKNKKYDMVVASSSRLFTAYLGYTIARKLRVPLYLDIRDIFYDTLEDVLKNGLLKKVSLPIIKHIEHKTFSYAKHINLISGGFKVYFEPYDNANYSYYPNGIDDIFLDEVNELDINQKKRAVKTIVYAGNFGEGQGLHKIIPYAAKGLGEEYRFILIGDGGTKKTLIEEIKRLKVSNVEIIPPVKRDELIKIYKKADFIFAHLNSYKAFEKVLPSKLFELATFPLPIIAGLSGFAAKFVEDNIDNVILFKPCSAVELIDRVKSYRYKQVIRTEFFERFRRENINKEIADSMLKYL